jgi:alpha-N-arabinofuranosidase
MHGGEAQFMNNKAVGCRCGLVIVLALVLSAARVFADPGSLIVRVDQPGIKISPTFYGLMTEEINHSYDGGLYAELIQNRIFEDTLPPPARARGRTSQPAVAASPTTAPTPPEVPLHWSVVAASGSAGSIHTDAADPVNAGALKLSLRLDITSAEPGRRAGVTNDGFWGIPVKPNTQYRAAFYARAGADFSGPLTVDIESNDGSTIYASAAVPNITADWKHYDATLTTGNVAATADTRFVISAEHAGQVFFSLVSLFPPTFNNRPNGNRIDLMELLGGMRPSFLRFPGGNYVEGDTIAQRFEWKDTIGPLEQRAGHWSPWRYRSSDGMGLLEFLEWCEDLHMQPVLAVYAGYSLRGEKVVGPALQPFVDDALDEIQYVTGDASTKWGYQRVLDGHPDPFPLTYVEIGNEDNLERPRTANTYNQRFAQFFDAIRAKYPNLKLIATASVTSRVPDLVDDHYYRTSAAMQRDVHHYDKTDRNGPKIFVGEWASREGNPTPTLNAALGDAAWLTGLERNSDVVLMQCYAPLLVNVNRGAMQWSTDLIGYNTLSSFGSPSYYVQKMFAANTGNTELPVEIISQSNPPATAPAGGLFAAASRVDSSGDVILKVVNSRSADEQLEIDLQGGGSVAPEATAWVISGKPSDVNTIASPEKVAPRQVLIHDAAAKFVHEFPADSVTVIRVSTHG